MKQNEKGFHLNQFPSVSVILFRNCFIRKWRMKFVFSKAEPLTKDSSLSNVTVNNFPKTIKTLIQSSRLLPAFTYSEERKPQHSWICGKWTFPKVFGVCVRLLKMLGDPNFRLEVFSLFLSRISQQGARSLEVLTKPPEGSTFFLNLKRQWCRCCVMSK